MDITEEVYEFVPDLYEFEDYDVDHIAPAVAAAGIGAIGRGIGSIFGKKNSVWTNEEYANILRGNTTPQLWAEFRKVSVDPRYKHRAPIARAELVRRGEIIENNTPPEITIDRQYQQGVKDMTGTLPNPRAGLNQVAGQPKPIQAGLNILGQNVNPITAIVGTMVIVALFVLILKK